MYESSMSAAQLIALARDGVDIAPDIGDEYYLLWLNALESLLYSGVVRCTRSAECAVEDGRVDLAIITPPEGESGPRACDVCAVFADGRELVRADEGALVRYPAQPAFCASGLTLTLQSPAGIPDKVTVLWRVRPALKTEQTMRTAPVALPDEFLPMAFDYLTGKAYALVSEDVQAANRLASYNAALADFELWNRAVGARAGGEV